MALKLTSLTILMIGTLQLTSVSMQCVGYEGPSPYAYGIDSQMEQRFNEHNLVAGWRQYGDSLIFETSVTAKWEKNKVVTASMQYPANGGAGPGVITHVLAIDELGTTGGVAYMTDGGIGFSYVKLGFQSRPNFGIHHTVKIYVAYSEGLVDSIANGRLGNITTLN